MGRGYFLHKRLLWKMGPAGARICVPRGANTVLIMQKMHKSKTAGHPRIRQNLAKIMGSFYCKGMYGYMVECVETCHKCQVSLRLRSIDRHAWKSQKLYHPEAPWDLVHMD